jgi:HD superfamily phosphohydrolase
MAEKLIRDPVHDVIAFRTDRPEEALLFRLLNTPEFQRLRRVRQLGLAALAYPGADHSRFSHCIGVMETARRMLARMEAFVPVTPEQRLVCLAAALLHDLGHGPFSHVFERVTGIHHEEVTREMILDPAGEVHRLLSERDARLPQRIVQFLGGRPQRTFLNDILSSQLDADRFDYLLRDNLMTGSRYGDFDLSWLLQALMLDPSSGRLAVAAKGISAVEDYLQARYHMYRNVYFHKVVRSAEGMLRLAVQRARRLAVQDRLAWPSRDHWLFKALLGQALCHEEFVQFDEVSMLSAFKVWSECEDQTLASLCGGLLFRRLYKVIDLSFVEDAAEAARIYAAARDAVMAAGGDADYDLFLDEPLETSYAIPSPGAADGQGDSIIVVDGQGRSSDFARSSPLVAALNRQLMFRRIHVAQRYRDVAAAAVMRAAGR